jgi:hypothetical protein
MDDLSHKTPNGDVILHKHATSSCSGLAFVPYQTRLCEPQFGLVGSIANISQYEQYISNACPSSIPGNVLHTLKHQWLITVKASTFAAIMSDQTGLQSSVSYEEDFFVINASNFHRFFDPPTPIDDLEDVDLSDSIEIVGDALSSSWEELNPPGCDLQGAFQVLHDSTLCGMSEIAQKRYWERFDRYVSLYLDPGTRLIISNTVHTTTSGLITKLSSTTYTIRVFASIMLSRGRKLCTGASTTTRSGTPRSS